MDSGSFKKLFGHFISDRVCCWYFDQEIVSLVLSEIIYSSVFIIGLHAIMSPYSSHIDGSGIPWSWNMSIKVALLLAFIKRYIKIFSGYLSGREIYIGTFGVVWALSALFGSKSLKSFKNLNKIVLRYNGLTTSVGCTTQLVYDTNVIDMACIREILHYFLCCLAIDG